LRLKLTAIILGGLLFAWAGIVAQTGTGNSNAPKKHTPKKSTAKKSNVKKLATPKSGAPKSHVTGSRPAQKKSTASAQGSKGRTTASRPAARRPVARPMTQGQPTPDRYREIQQALITRGYMSGEPTGGWGPDSEDALKRFQLDQNIPADGKINSLSLIALGLGPKRATMAQARPE
jgi:Putative peptidoglycan binding domain